MDRLCQGYTRQVGPNQEFGCMLGALYSRIVSRRFGVMSDSETRFSPRLTQDDFGISAYPTIQTKIVTELTTRDRRMVRTL